MNPTEQTVLKIGGEGGCIELLGVETDGAWRFRLATNEAALIDFLNEKEICLATGRSWVTTWEAALTLLDEYPWQHLYPLVVHPEFHKQIYSALLSRHADQESYEWLEWNELMFGGTKQ